MGKKGSEQRVKRLRWKGPASFLVSAIRLCALILYILLSSNPCLQSQPSGAVGTIRGNVSDIDFGDVLSGVRIKVLETGDSTNSEDRGDYRLENLAPGTYTVTFTKAGFTTMTRRDVLVQPNQLTDLNVELESQVFEMEEMVVQGTDILAGTEEGLLELRKETAGLVDSIGAEMFSLSGASSADQALTQVVGTTVDEDKRVVVRGLGDRYVQVTLNGLRVPSPDPRKRGVKADIFPTEVVNSINVFKSFTPDMQGDTIGGQVDIRSKSIPDELTLKAGVSVEFNTQATGNEDFLTYEGGGVNFSGRDDGGRKKPFSSDYVIPEAFPPFVPANTPYGDTGTIWIGGNVPTPQTSSAAQAVEEPSEQFSPVMGTKKKKAPPSYSFKMTAADNFELPNDQAIGAIGTFNYSNKFSHDGNWLNLDYDTEPDATNPNLLPSRTFDKLEGAKSEETLTVGGLVGLGYELDSDNVISLNVLYNQITSDDVLFAIDDDTTDLAPVDFRTKSVLNYTERMLASAQLRGDHTLVGIGNGDIETSWTGGYNISHENVPDRRLLQTTGDFDANPGVVTYEIGDGGEGTAAASALRQWRHTEDNNFQAAWDIKVPFEFLELIETIEDEKDPGFFKLGSFASYTRRDFEQDSFFGSIGSRAEDEQIEGDPYDPFTQPQDPTVGVDGAVEAIRRRDFVTLYGALPSIDFPYEGDETILAAHVTLEVPITEKFKVGGGVRGEYTKINVDMQPREEDINPGLDGNQMFVNIPDATGALERRNDISVDDAGPSIEQFDWLPSAYATYAITDDMNVRLSYSQNIGRPTFLEITPSEELDLFDDQLLVGNPTLQLSKSENYDMRWEWFPNPGDVASIGVFYKEITNPIEKIKTENNEDTQLTTWVNQDTAQLVGLEVELRKRLDFIHEALKNFTLGVNATWIESRVDVDTRQAEAFANNVDANIDINGRTLSEQPEYILNANFRYSNKDTGTTAAIFYNVTGEIQTSPSSVVSNQLLESEHQLRTESLNATLSQSIAEHWKITIRGKNLTNPVIETVARDPNPAAYDIEGDVLVKRKQKGIGVSIGVSYDW